MWENLRPWIVFGAIALLIAMNLLSLSQIADLRDDLDHIERQTTRLSDLERELTESSIRISEMAEDQRMVTDLMWQINGDSNGSLDCDEALPVTASWTFRRLHADARVRLELRTDDDDWIEVPARRQTDFDYQATHNIDLDQEWHYRIAVQGDSQLEVTDPEPAPEINRLADKRVLFEIGENRNQDGRTWMRFMVAPMAPQLTSCNEIVAASLTFSGKNDAMESIVLDTGRPGDNEPEGYDPEVSGSSSAVAESGAMAFDTTTEVPDPARTPGEDDHWWTDWVEVDTPVEPVLELQYVDGSTRQIDDFGMNK